MYNFQHQQLNLIIFVSNTFYPNIYCKETNIYYILVLIRLKRLLLNANSMQILV